MFRPILQIDFTGLNKSIYCTCINLDPYVRPQSAYSSIKSNPKLHLKDFYIQVFQEDYKYWIDTPQIVNSTTVSQIANISSSTGKIIIEFIKEEVTYEFICSYIEGKQLVGIGGLFYSHMLFRDLKALNSNIPLFFDEVEDSDGGLNYRIIRGKAYSIKDWAYIKSIRPYNESMPEIANYNNDYQGYSLRHFNEGPININDIFVRIGERGISYTLKDETTTHRRGDHDGGFEHDSITFEAFASKSFSSKTDFETYLDRLKSKGYNIDTSSNSIKFDNANYLRTIYQLSSELEVKFSFSYSSFTEPCE